jgi:hypothetical protein
MNKTRKDLIGAITRALGSSHAVSKLDGGMLPTIANIAATAMLENRDAALAFLNDKVELKRAGIMVVKDGDMEISLGKSNPQAQESPTGDSMETVNPSKIENDVEEPEGVEKAPEENDDREEDGEEELTDEDIVDSEDDSDEDNFGPASKPPPKRKTSRRKTTKKK